MNEISITIVNWEKYNPQDFQQRYPHWFRLNKDLLNSPTVFGLSYPERWVWIGLMCIACERKNKTIRATKKWFCHRLQVEEKVFDITIEKLAIANSLAIDCQSKPILSPPTIQNNTIQITSSTGVERDTNLSLTASTIDGAYALYPRKEGKTAGYKKLKTQIKTKEDAERFKQAVINYRKRLEQESRPKEFIKLFSTFCSKEVWTDFAPKAAT